MTASGAAALINQVVWQTSVKRFLGGSEAMSSMVVVLVFMGGLGLGSAGAGRSASRFARPALALAAVEVGLAALGIGVRALLDGDLPETVVQVQRVATSVQVPLLAVCAAGAVLLLLAPCLAMGATLPLASEACQRQLGLHDARVLGLLFGLNTLGSVAGAVLGSVVLQPSIGHSRSLLVAAALNLSAGLVFLALGAGPAARPSPAVPGGAGSPAPAAATSVFRDNVLALGLGFCSLGYEMYLLRLIPLRHEPLPLTFPAVIAGFLLFWSLGAAATARVRVGIGLGLVLAAAGVLASVVAFQLDSFRPITGLDSLVRFLVLRSHYFVPAFFFGMLFAEVNERAARHWGADVGRLAAFNTLGSCAGVIAVTFVGYEIHLEWLAMALIGGLLVLEAIECGPRHRWVPAAVAAAGLSLASLMAVRRAAEPPLWVGRGRSARELYFGRNGVIGIDAGGSLFWNGLWHSELSRDGGHLGSINWMIGAAPVLSHGRAARDACVIGLGTGITAATLARLGSIDRVDVYEINPTLRRVFARHPDGMLQVLRDPKVRVMWQDARIGMAIEPRQYDIIVSQPLYLRQAGSGLLNSVEFYRSVASRLRPGGVFCLYSNGGAAQAFVVRQTAAAVFRWGESFLSGYLLVLSDEPLELTPAALSTRFERGRGDPLWEEIRRNPATRDPAAVLALVDRPRLPWGDGGLVITDDWPVVEYGSALARRLDSLGYREPLPRPAASRRGEVAR